LSQAVAGGVVYSVGVTYFLWEGLKFQTAIGHFFVAIAAACQFVAVFFAFGR
jgi:hemolysin III